MSTQDHLRVLTGDGKYEVVVPADHKAHALRHGEPWRELIGDNLILALAYDLDEARETIKTLQSEIDALREKA